MSSTKVVPAFKALSIRKQVALDDLQGLVGNTFITASEVVKEKGAEITGKTIHLTHSMDDNHVDAEILVPVSKEVESSNLKYTEIPETTVAFVSVKGSYENVFSAFESLSASVSAPKGPARTVYVVSPVDTLDESKWETEIQIPV
eukprot:TRINITY_DN572_c0_g1_i1.p2 TRINITY_DN572_c0_g1~~TRINITY_DN572_c0_g1_i1.p2  ORF type:complete len:145 (-),score=38.74 TRINITY_DN572_c0_g1_i1:158-592(-)